MAKRAPKSPFKKVTIGWYDAVTDAGWTSVDKVKEKKLEYVETSGYLVLDDPDRIIIANSVSYDPEAEGWQVNGWTVIPAQWAVRKS